MPIPPTLHCMSHKTAGPNRICVVSRIIFYGGALCLGYVQKVSLAHHFYIGES